MASVVHANKMKGHLLNIFEGKPVDVRDNRGWEGLHVAAYHGHVDCLDIILEQGMDLFLCS